MKNLLIPLWLFIFYNTHIVGNEVAKKFPFLAAVYKTTADGSYFCSGSRISPRWIVTASQCVEEAIFFTIYLGTNSKKTPSSTSLKLVTRDYVLHPEYDPLTLKNDVGLIKLVANVIHPAYVSLPFLDLSDGAELQAAGWEQTKNELHGSYLSTISNDECKFTYGNEINNNMVCMIGKNNEGICCDNIGTPILYFSRGVFFLQGIATLVSVYGCESADPSGYTKIYPYVDWIRNVTKLL